MKLSIIMPSYNMADTLPRAFDSIAMKQEFGEYEVIVVDDESSDNTADVIDQYRDVLPIKYIKNEQNSGNAHSFYVGLRAAQGDYFCVLDGDDFYTVQDKLVKQVSFLDDDVREEYVAVGTQFVVDFGDGNVHIPDVSPIREFTYADFLQGRFAYCHTATYMYRNIFRDMDPVFFDSALHRGDTPRTLFHLMYTDKKVRVLDFVGSAYSYTFKGIWSSSNERQHFAYQVSFYTNLQEEMDTQFERDCIGVTLQRNRDRMNTVSEEALHHYEQISIDEAIRRAEVMTGVFAYAQRTYVFRGAFYSEYIDSLTASLGYIARLHDPSLRQTRRVENSIVIVVPQLVPRGGGLFGEISDLVRIYSDYKVTIIKTDPGEHSEEARECMSAYPNVELLYCEEGSEERFATLSRLIAQAAPKRIYYYCSHMGAMGSSLMDRYGSENVCLFSYDHGFVTGVSNPNITWIGAKRSVDYKLLSKRFPGKVKLVPAWSSAPELPEGSEYVPFKGHDGLITASGAARFYKLDGKRPCSYFELIAQSLEKTGGKHYHFGEIPVEAMLDLQMTLAKHNVPTSRFVNITWSDNIPADLLRFGVDLFIEPFPTVSYKLTLEVMSCGVPVIAYRGLRRMEIADFIPADSPKWSTVKEYLEIVSNLDEQTLLKLSGECVELFNGLYSFDAMKNYILSDREELPEDIPPFTDCEFRNVADYLPMYGLGRISLMNDERFATPKPESPVVDEVIIMQREMDLRQQEIDKLRFDITELRKSKAYKLGMLFARPIRKARRAIKGK